MLTITSYLDPRSSSYSQPQSSLRHLPQGVHPQIDQWKSSVEGRWQCLNVSFVAGSNFSTHQSPNLAGIPSPNPLRTYPSTSSFAGSSKLAGTSSNPLPTLVETTGTESNVSVRTPTQTAVQNGNSAVRPDGNFALTLAIDATSSLVFPCTFGFLRCEAQFEDECAWRTHCLSHFRSHPPPCRISCPFCDELDKRFFEDPHEAWEHRMSHIAGHIRARDVIRTCNSDSNLCYYLMQKKIISHADFKELQGKQIQRTMPGPYLVTNHPERREERRSNRTRH